ncbi:myeloid leukemia factor isoform X2 [Cimex lectularius]|uniref:Myeloid leukemia factor n=1 Tax=Cimex lectularius TaxID=79782 RepID=A0A8I6SD03_CIMLE|nr:myeloid leukemia factor isoform X2 [Cimex lectularius]
MFLFGSLPGEVEEDPFVGGHMWHMNQMMNGFFRDPFQDMMGMIGNDAAYRGGHPHRSSTNSIMGDLATGGGIGELMPFGFPNLGRVFQDMNNASGHMTSMSTVMTMTQGPDGRPQVYQASTSTRQGPGGVRETKKTVADSRTGVKKMSIGHHIYDRAHVIEREQNVYSGDQEERQEFINLDEDDAEEFQQEWEAKTRSTRTAIGYGGAQPHGSRRYKRDRAQPQLALTSGTSQEEPQQPSSSRHSVRNALKAQTTSALPQTTSIAAKIAHRYGRKY